jgi:hypothetical protein
MQAEIKEDLAELKALVAELSVTLKNEIKTLKKEFKGLVEIQQKLIHERLGAPIPAPPTNYGEEDKKQYKSINIEYQADGTATITGKNTFNYKELIKESGNGRAKFITETKGWNIPSSGVDSLIEKLNDLNLQKDKDYFIKNKPESGAKSSAKTVKKSSKSSEESDEESDQDEEFGFA